MPGLQLFDAITEPLLFTTVSASDPHLASTISVEEEVAEAEVECKSSLKFSHNKSIVFSSFSYKKPSQINFASDSVAFLAS